MNIFKRNNNKNLKQALQEYETLRNHMDQRTEAPNELVEKLGHTKNMGYIMKNKGLILKCHRRAFKLIEMQSKRARKSFDGKQEYDVVALLRNDNLHYTILSTNSYYKDPSKLKIGDTFMVLQHALRNEDIQPLLITAIIRDVIKEKKPVKFRASSIEKAKRLIMAAIQRNGHWSESSYSGSVIKLGMRITTAAGLEKPIRMNRDLRKIAIEELMKEQKIKYLVQEHRYVSY